MKKYIEKNKKAKEYKNRLKKLAKKIEEKANYSYVTSDPTRLKILIILQENKKMCTSELANILEVTASAISHQKSILERFGFIKSYRNGKIICCYLSNSRLTSKILNGIK